MKKRRVQWACLGDAAARHGLKRPHRAPRTRAGGLMAKIVAGAPAGNPRLRAFPMTNARLKELLRLDAHHSGLHRVNSY